MGFPGGLDGKESACSAGVLGSIPGSGRFPWRRKWLPTPVSLPAEFHGQRQATVDRVKELDMTEQLAYITLSFKSRNKIMTSINFQEKND